MPKQEYPLQFWHGGLSNDSNPRDIADHELQQADNVIISDIGKIKLMGSFVSRNTAFVINDITKGYGLFLFGVDYPLPGNTSKKFLAIAGYNNSGDYIIKIFDENGNAYTGNDIQINTVDHNNNFMPVFFYIDGGLRICDGNFNVNSVNYWFGYIKRRHFSGVLPGNSADFYDGWYKNENTLAAPTVGLAGSMDGITTHGSDTTLGDTGQFTNYYNDIYANYYYAINIDEDIAVLIIEAYNADALRTNSISLGGTEDGYWWSPGAGGSDSYSIFPIAGKGFNIHIVIGSGGGTWKAGDYEFASTFIYDGNQESLPFKMGGFITLNSGEYFDSTSKIYCTSPFNPRITGGRIYVRKRNSDDEWILLCDISLEKGSRTILDGDYKSWKLVSGISFSNYYVWCYIGDNVIDPNIDTYNTLNGFNPGDQKTLSIKYKTAVVANRMAYVGNVEYNGVKYEDAIFKSFVNKFDTFTLDRRLELARGDGESIVKLEEYADRLLVFKEKTLYIINISQNIEFIEAKFPYRGVLYSYQTVSTEYGIAWANKFGCYLYDGKQIHDLLLDRENPGRRKISIGYWQSFWDETGSIAFDPNEKRLLLFADITSSSSENIMVYSFIVGSWTRGIAKLRLASHKYTNFCNDLSDGSIIAYDVTSSYFDEWDNTGDLDSVDIRTKEITFQAYAADKRFYGVDIKHKVLGTMALQYSVNGGYFDNTLTLLSSVSYGNYYISKYRVSNVIDVNSIALRIYGTFEVTDEIDDITLIYRPKGVH